MNEGVNHTTGYYSNKKQYEKQQKHKTNLRVCDDVLDAGSHLKAQPTPILEVGVDANVFQVLQFSSHARQLLDLGSDIVLSALHEPPPTFLLSLLVKPARKKIT